MLDIQFYHAKLCHQSVNFLKAPLLLLGRISFCQSLDSVSCLRFVLYDPGFPENDDTAKIRGIFLRYHAVFIDNAEGSLFISCNGIYLMPRFGTMKKDFGIMVRVAERDRIRIAIVSGYGQNTGGSSLQDIDTFSFR